MEKKYDISNFAYNICFVIFFVYYLVINGHVKLLKNLMRFVFLISVIMLCVAVLIQNPNIFNSNYKQIEISEVEYRKVGDNLYYTDELILEKGQDEISVFSDFQLISEYIKQQFNCDIYISNFNYYLINGNEKYFYGYQMVDGILLKDTFFTLTVDDKQVMDLYLHNGGTFIDEDITVTDLKSEDEIIGIANGLAKENKSKMLQPLKYERIKGKYHMEFSKDTGLYYKVELNYKSYITIDAKTGNVIDKYFFNGIINFYII